MERRLLSAFLAVMMVLTMAPVAFAADTSVDSYDSLVEAINSASDGDTITLNGDIDVQRTLVVTKKLTLDLAGHKLYNTKDLWDAPTEKDNNWSLISVRENGDLTITGNGTLDAKKDDCYAVDVQDETAKATLENGTFVGNITTVYVFEGTLVVKDGSYSIKQLNSNGVQNQYGLTINCYDQNYKNGTAKVLITGGTFAHFNPVDNAAEGTGTNFATSGYETVEGTDGLYTAQVKSDNAAAIDDVQYATLADAVAAANNGDTVTLLKNTAEDVVIPADKTVTLDLNGKKLTNVQSDTITVTKGAKLTIAGKGTVDNVTNGKAAVYNNGTTTLNGGKYTRSAEADNTTSSSGGNSYYNILNHGAMTINEGVEVYSSGHFSSLVANGYYDYSATQKGDRTAYIESVGQAAPALTINNGTFSGGINTIKNDDNATLTINSGEFSNVTQAVVQNNNIATVNGGTFDADGYHALENWKYNSNYNAGNLTVTNGKFAGSIATNAAVKISGGLYTENPSKYLAASVKDGYKYAAVKHVSPYLFEVKEILNENVEVIPNVGAAKAKSAEGVVDKDDVAKVDAAAKVVAAPKISEAAAVVADKVDAKQYTEKATNITTADRIEVRAYLEVTPKEYSADSYKLNITPKYDIVVVGTDNQEQKFTGDTLLVSNETPVSVQLPDGFVTNTNGLYVQHKGHEYNADVSVNTVKVNGVDKNIYTAKFNNPDGFSDFTITKTTQSVAVIGNNKYTTLQNAIDAAQTGATIVLQKNCTEKVTVAGKSLTINRNSKTFDEANVTVGSNCTKEVKNDTIVVTYTKPSSGGSSGGSSSGKTTYKVTTSAVNNGGVNASPSNAEKGATITITLSPDKGYKLDKLTVTDGSGKTVSTVKKSDTVYTFTMPASAVKVGVSYVKATETPSETKFNDVSANDWFASAVDYVTGKGMMNGTADNTFSPKANTTRGMVVTVLYRLENQPSTSAASFTDVASGAYYANAVAWANANGIVSGYGSGKFGPNDKVTREQLAAILYRYAQYKKYDVSVGEDTNILSYDDAQSISSYAIPAIQWACGAGVVTGKSGSKLDPKGNATRAEVAAMLMRFCENVK